MQSQTQRFSERGHQYEIAVIQLTIEYRLTIAKRI